MINAAIILYLIGFALYFIMPTHYYTLGFWSISAVLAYISIMKEP